MRKYSLQNADFITIKKSFIHNYHFFITNYCFKPFSCFLIFTYFNKQQMAIISESNPKLWVFSCLLAGFQEKNPCPYYI